MMDTAGNLLSDDMLKALEGPAMDVMEFYQQPIEESATEEDLLALLLELNTRSEAFMQAVSDFFREKGWILLLTAGLEMLLTPVFMAPLYGALLDAYRKKTLTIPGCLGYLRLGPKSLLLAVWMMLRVYAWMLPGMALAVVAAFIPALSSLLMMVGIVASVVLVIRALLHYGLAPIVLVDRPELSVNACIRESWQVMRTRKMEYFMLRISFVLWLLLVDLLMMLAVNPVMMAICLALTMMANLLLTIYINGSVVVFWDTHGVKRETNGMSAEMESHPDVPGDDLN